MNGQNFHQKLSLHFPSKTKTGKNILCTYYASWKTEIDNDTLKWVKRLIRPHKWNARSNSKIDDNMKDGKKCKSCKENQQNPE
jgi:hypothetical protein